MRIKINSVLTLLFFLMSVSFVQASQAEELFVECETCTTQSSFLMRAKAKALTTAEGIHEVIVANPNTYDIWRVTVNVIVPVGRGGRKTVPAEGYILESVEATQAQKDNFKDFMEVISKQLVYEPESDSGAWSTCDSMSAGDGRCGSLQVWLRGQPEVNAWATASIGTTLWRKLFGKNELIVVVVYPDGSSEEWKLVDPINVTISFEPVPNTARNADGTLVSSGSSSGGGAGGIPSGGTGSMGTLPSGDSCEWWRFTVTQGGEVIRVYYECI